MLMNISERSASRLIHKGKDLTEDEIDQEILDHVDNLIENQEELIGKRPTPATPVVHEPKVQDDSKKKTAFRMLAMNVRVSVPNRVIDFKVFYIFASYF